MKSAESTQTVRDTDPKRPVIAPIPSRRARPRKSLQGRAHAIPLYNSHLPERSLLHVESHLDRRPASTVRCTTPVKVGRKTYCSSSGSLLRKATPWRSTISAACTITVKGGRKTWQRQGGCSGSLQRKATRGAVLSRQHALSR